MVVVAGVGEGGGEPLGAVVVDGLVPVEVVVGGTVPRSGGVIIERGVTNLRLTMRR